MCKDFILTSHVNLKMKTIEGLDFRDEGNIINISQSITYFFKKGKEILKYNKIDF